MKTKGWFLIVLFLTGVFTACSSDNDPKIDPEGVSGVNNWIYDTMDTYYLWYDEMPSKKGLNMNQDPEEFFKTLLSDQDGKIINGSRHYFSTIEKKSSLTKAIYENEPTYGFDFAIFRVQGTNNIYALVLYVLPNSPAYDAGLKRGDWIVSIRGNNGEAVNITNFSVLESGNQVVFNLAEYDSEQSDPVLVESGSLAVAASRLVENTPFLKDTVLHIGGKNIGYLAYNHFSDGPDGTTDRAWDNQMKALFADFKSRQVNEFVLDLRYNGGGLVSSSILLSSFLAPTEALGNIWGYMVYNKRNGNRSTLSFEKQTAVSSGNLNLKRLYVLTGTSTASASEAVINMLIPYMGRENIRLIGEQTIGKNVGSNTFGEDEEYDYLLHPITLRIYNKDEKADYDDGFEPDIFLKELEFGQPMSEFGEPDELLLSAAIQEITGLRSASLAAPSTRPAEIIYRSSDKRNAKGLIIDPVR